MIYKKGFDNEKYLDVQTQAILKRASKFENKLYLEFGGKLLFDYHAERVLPGFDANVKLELLKKLRDKIEILLCIYAGDIERRKIRADFGITYDADAFKLIDDLNKQNIEVKNVVITRFNNQPLSKIFKNKLEHRGINVYTHYFTKGYPTDVNLIVSDGGYGLNDYIPTKKPLIIVTGPGPGSGKLSTCLSQMYHDYKRGINSGYAKFETFPVWNVPLKHNLNIAYEAATADIKDYNIIDPFHLEMYNKTAVNYNRDVELFPVLKRILEKITGKSCIYKSPTDMGVNMIRFGIIDDEVVKEAAKQEIIRRYFRYSHEHIMGLSDRDTLEKAELIMKEINAKPEDRKVVKIARQTAKEAKFNKKSSNGLFCGAAVELHNGTVITGKNSDFMTALSSLILNAIKTLATIPDEIDLLSPHIITSIENFKKNLGLENTCLSLDEVLIAIGISAATNSSTQFALGKLNQLKGCEAHVTHIPSSDDELGMRKLGINLTTDTNFLTKSFFIQ